MHSNITEQIKKMYSAFGKLSKLPKALIKYGCYISLAVLTLGCILVLLNYIVLPFSSYLDLVSKTLVKTSFILAAESIIGGLVIDFLFRK